MPDIAIDTNVLLRSVDVASAEHRICELAIFIA